MYTKTQNFIKIHPFVKKILIKTLFLKWWGINTDFGYLFEPPQCVGIIKKNSMLNSTEHEL